MDREAHLHRGRARARERRRAERARAAAAGVARVGLREAREVHGDDVGRALADALARVQPGGARVSARVRRAEKGRLHREVGVGVYCGREAAVSGG